MAYFFRRKITIFSKNPAFSETFPLLHTLFSFPYKTTNKNVAPSVAVAATSISLMTSTTMVVFEFFQKKRSCSKRRPRIRAWLLGSWEQCSLEEEEASFVFPTKSFWMHQKLWRKFAIIEVALAFYCALAGMARGRASIQFTKLPQVVPVW